MKVKDIAKRHDIERNALEEFIKASSFKYSSSFGGLSLDDSEDENAVVAAYKAFCEKQAAEKEAQRKAEEEERRKKEELARIEREKQAQIEAERRRKAEELANRKRETLANMIIVSGCHIEGYKIVKYCKYLSVDSATEVDRGLANFNSTARENALNTKDRIAEVYPSLRNKALKDLKEKVFDAGGNAIIGFTYDYNHVAPVTSGVNGVYYLPYVFNVTANGTAVVIEKE